MPKEQLESKQIMSSPNEVAMEGNSPVAEGFLAVDEASFTQEIAGNYGLIMAVGALNLIGGVMALMSPIAATVTILGLLTFCMILLGGLNMCGAFLYYEKIYRIPAFVSGFVLSLLGILMASNVIVSLSIMTLIVAINYMVEGCARSAIALKNKSMPGYLAVLVSGISAILLSIIILAAFPTSSEYTLGILLGCNWVTWGLQRITLGFMGRSTANAALANFSASGGYVNAP